MSRVDGEIDPAPDPARPGRSPTPGPAGRDVRSLPGPHPPDPARRRLRPRGARRAGHLGAHPGRRSASRTRPSSWPSAGCATTVPPPCRHGSCTATSATATSSSAPTASAPCSTGSWPTSGDPLEDLGWLCVKAWRFGERPQVGGFGSVDDLVTAYEAESGTTVDRDALHWWQVLGTLKWGIICIHQAERHRSGCQPLGRAGRDRPASSRDRVGPPRAASLTEGRRLSAGRTPSRRPGGTR